jgi:3-hydroxyisobutyrate dehydrogenase-like beta-hydroxyacid dehydrogenase
LVETIEKCIVGLMTDTPQIPSVGFIGLGVMGEPMAGHLARAGYRLTLFDSVPGLAARLAASLERSSAADTPADVARTSDIVITMVPNGETVRDLVRAPDGLLEGFRAGSLLLDT